MSQRDAYKKLRDAEGRGHNFGVNHLQYPEDLTSASQGHYIQFFIREPENPNIKFAGGSPSSAGGTSYGAGGGKSTLSKERPATKRLEKSISLYMPAQVSLSQDAKYGEVEIGAATAAAIAAYKNYDGTGSFVSAVGAAVDSAMESGAEALKTALDAAAPGAKAALDIDRGAVTNNRLEMIFEGISRRSFSFSFKMMPKSENEAKSVDNIVNTFRYHMAPSFAEETNISRTFIVPSLFDIEYYYSGGQNNFLNKISTSVLESCNVTYGGERVQFFRPSSTVRGIGGTGGGDGAPPVETNIELQFRELEVITREKIAEGF